MQLRFPHHRLILDSPRVMGVLNVTPDSFSDGGLYIDQHAAVSHAVRMVEEGADIIDIGGESTRPGAAPVSLQEELDRVLPVIERLVSAIDTPVSVDTSKPAVMREAIAAGAAMINDVRALRTPEALETAAELAVPVCLMHMQGEPRAMQQDPQYHDVVDDVVEFLRSRVESSLDAGVLSENLVVDPGFGFGKTLQHNLRLLEHLDRLVQIGYPVLAGMSRKSMIGHILGNDTGDWLAGSITLAVLARQNGAHIIRVHDVGPTVQALRVLEAAQAGI